MRQRAVIAILGMTLIMESYCPVRAEEVITSESGTESFIQEEIPADQEETESSDMVISEESGFEDDTTLEENGFSGEENSFTESDFTDGLAASEEAGFSDADQEETESSEAEETGTISTKIADDATEVTLAVSENSDITKELNQVLKLMGQRACDEKPCKVVIPPGNYYISNTIHMYSNLTLYAEGAVITKSSTSKHVILRLGEEVLSSGGYDGYQNIIIEGGIWDCNYMNVEDKENGSGFVGFRIGHARHVTVKNVTFLNNLKSHFLEIAGVEDVLITGCTFRGYWEPYEAGGQECIQLDACLDYIFPGYQPFDGAVCENVLIEGNTFENVFAGVGSHSLVYDHPYKNIVVRGNTFRNVRKRAVWFLNYTDSVIEDNTMENVGGGILVSNLFLANTHLAPEQNAGISGNQQPANITIRRNQISVSDTALINGSSWKSYGILVQGSKVSEGEKADARGIAAGIYKETNVTVEENTIAGPGRGILLYLAENCVVKNNQLSLQRSPVFSNIGICVTASSQNEISNNQVSGCKNVGIYVYNGGKSLAVSSVNNQIFQNQVSNAGGDGILLDAGSDGTLLSENEVVSSGKNGIYVKSSKQCRIIACKVSDCRLDGIILEKLGNPIIKSNTVTEAGGRGLVLLNSTVKMLAGNTASENKKCGLYVTNSKIAGCRKNKLQGNGSRYGIYAKKCSGIVSVKLPQNNRITRKTVKIAGNASGGKSLTVYTLSGAKKRKIGSCLMKDKKKYAISIAKQKKGTRLLFVLKDSYGNICYQVQKVK